jgi:hypothetical protein
LGDPSFHTTSFTIEPEELKAFAQPNSANRPLSLSGIFVAMLFAFLLRFHPSSQEG